MKMGASLLIPLSVLCAAGIAIGQGMLTDIVGNKVIDKYQSATCEQLWQQNLPSKSDEEQKTVEFLHNDPQARRAFLNKVAAPVASKLFECGMIP